MRNFRTPRMRGTEDIREIEPLLDEYEVADLLGIKLGTLRFWRRKQERRGPPFVKVGSLVRYRPEDLQKYLSEHSVRTRAVGVSGAPRTEEICS